MEEAIPNGCLDGKSKQKYFKYQAKVKFVFSKKATKFDKIFTVDLTLTAYCQINGEDFVNFCGLLRKHELYLYCTSDR